jgi:hypothetical protein
MQGWATGISFETFLTQEMRCSLPEGAREERVAQTPGPKQ